MCIALEVVTSRRCCFFAFDVFIDVIFPSFRWSPFSSCALSDEIMLGFHADTHLVHFSFHLSSLRDAVLMACLHFSFLRVSTQFPVLNVCIFASTYVVLLLI